MKYRCEIFEGVLRDIEVCKFLNNNHISPERIISLTPIEYFKYPGYDAGREVKKVVLFYIEE